MKAQRNTMFLAGGAVALVLLGLVGYLVWRGMAELKEIEGRLEDGKARLRELYSRNPFPSHENAAREKRNVATLQAWLDDLLALLSSGQADVQDKRPSHFMNLLREKNGELLQKAARATQIPEKFGFGFDAYFRPDSSLPSPDAVPALTEQLLTIESLCRILFEEGALAIVSIEREGVPGELTSASSPAAAAPKAGAAPDAAAKSGLYTHRSYALQFKAVEPALVKILNRLASFEHFTVVTRLECRKDGLDVHPTIRVGAGGGELPSGADLRNLDRAARTVSGPALAAPIHVDMNLVVYRFKKEE